MPIGNPDLSADIAASVANTPPPATDASPSEQRMNTTVARRAVEGVADGNRKLTTKQVESLAWLSKRGYITNDGLQNFLQHGTFDDPDDAEFISHDPDKILYTMGRDGTPIARYVPPTLGRTNAGDMFDSSQMGAINDFFSDPWGTGEDDSKAKGKIWSAQFINAIREDPGSALGVQGITREDISKMAPHQLYPFALNWMAMKKLENTYEDHTWKAWVPGLENKFEDLQDGDGNQVGPQNIRDVLIDIGREDLARDTVIPAIPNAERAAQAALMEMATSEDPADRLDARIYSSSDQNMRALERAILEARAAQAQGQ
jgi:hypothetical protein